MHCFNRETFKQYYAIVLIHNRWLSTVELINCFRYLENLKLEKVLAVHQEILILRIICCVYTLFLYLHVKGENVALKVLHT